MKSKSILTTQQKLDSHRIMVYDLILGDMSPLTRETPSYKESFLPFLAESFSKIVENRKELFQDEHLQLDKVWRAIQQMQRVCLRQGCDNPDAFSEKDLVKPGWNFWPISFYPLIGVSHAMVLGFNTHEAVLFNVGLGRPKKDGGMYSWRRSSVEKELHMPFSRELYSALGVLVTKKHSDIAQWQKEFNQIMQNCGWEATTMKSFRLKDQKSGTCQMKSTMAAIRSLNDDPYWGRSIKIWLQMSATSIMIECMLEEPNLSVISAILENVIPKFAKHFAKDEIKFAKKKGLLTDLLEEDFRKLVQLSKKLVKNYRISSHDKVFTNRQEWLSPTQWPSLNPQPLGLLHVYFSLQTFKDKYIFTYNLLCKKNKANEGHPIVVVLLNDLLSRMTKTFTKEGFKGLWKIYVEMEPSLDQSLIQKLEDENSLGLDYSLLGDEFRQMTAYMMTAFYHLSWFFYVKGTLFRDEKLTMDGANARFDFYHRFFVMFDKYDNPPPLKYCMESLSVHGLKKTTEAWQQCCKNKKVGLGAEKAFLNSIEKDKVHNRHTFYLNPTNSFNSWVLANFGNKRFEKKYERFFPAGEVFVSKKLFSVAKIWRGYVESKKVGNFNQTSRCTAPAEEACLTFDAIEPIDGFLGTTTSLFKHSLNQVILDHGNNSKPIHTAKAVLHSLCAKADNITDFLNRFSLLLVNDHNMLSLPHLFGLGSRNNDGQELFNEISSYVSIVFFEGLHSIQWKQKDDDEAFDFLVNVHNVLDRTLTSDRDVRICRILWNVSASLCEKMHARNCVHTKYVHEVLNRESSFTGLNIDLDQNILDIRARARWLMGLAKVTEDPSDLGSLFVWISVHLSRLSPEEKIYIEVDFKTVFDHMKSIHPGTYRLHPISNVIFQKEVADQDGILGQHYSLIVSAQHNWEIGPDDGKKQKPMKKRGLLSAFQQWRKKRYKDKETTPHIVVWKNFAWLSDRFQFTQCIGVFKPEDCILFPQKEKIIIQERRKTSMSFSYGEATFELESGCPLCMTIADKKYYLDVFSDRNKTETIGLEQFALNSDSAYSCWVPLDATNTGVLRFHHSEVLLEWDEQSKQVLRPYGMEKDTKLKNCLVPLLFDSVLKHWSSDTVMMFSGKKEFCYLPKYGLHFFKQSDVWISGQFPEWCVDMCNIPGFFNGIRGKYALILKHRKKQNRWRILIHYTNGVSYETIDCNNDGPLCIDQRWFIFMWYLLQNKWHTLEGNLLARRHVLRFLPRYLAGKNAQLELGAKTILKNIKTLLVRDTNPYSVGIISHINNILDPEEKRLSKPATNRNLRQGDEHPVFHRVAHSLIEKAKRKENESCFPQCWSDKSEFDNKPDFLHISGSFKDIIQSMLQRSVGIEKKWQEFIKELKNTTDNLDKIIEKNNILIRKFSRFDGLLKDAIQENQPFFQREGKLIYGRESWLKVLQACLKNDQKAQQMLGVSQKILQKIREGTAYWLFLKTEIQHGQRIQSCTNNRDLYHLLNNKRHYDPKDDAFYGLLLMEYVKDIRLNKKQVELYSDMIKTSKGSKGWLREAVMGVGKTTIIPAIVAQWKSGVVLLPESIFEAQYETLSQECFDIYGIHFERFDRFYNIENGLCNVKALNAFIKSGAILVGTPSQFQELEMEIINRKNAHKSAAWAMYKRLRSFGNVLCDECDEVMNPGIAYVQAYGKEEPCDPTEVFFFIRMLRWLLQKNLLKSIMPREESTIHGRRFLRDNTNKSWQDNILEQLKNCPSDILNVKSRNLFLELIHKNASWDELHQIENQTVSSLYDLIYSMLPFASHAVCGYDYGEAEGSDIVIPYRQGKATQLQFSTVNEKVILSVLYFYQKGFTQEQFQKYVKHLLDERRDTLNLQGMMKDEMIRPFLSVKSDLMQLFPENDKRFTQGYKCFDEMGSTNESAQQIGETWWKIVLGDKELYARVLDSMMLHFFVKQIGYYSQMPSIYSIDVAFLGTLCGFSATINPKRIDPGYFQLKEYEPNRALVIANAARLDTPFRDLDDFYNDWQNFDGHCVIDVNKSIDVFSMHEYIKRVVLEEHTRFDYALYFVNDFPYLLKSIEGKWVQIKLKSTTKKELQANGVSNFDKLFVFFDAAHCRGIDVPLSKEAKAWVLIGEHCTMDQTLQGIGRLRSISKDHLNLQGQNIELLVSKQLYCSLGYSSVDDLKREGVIEFFVRLEKRDREKTENNAVQVARQLVRHRFRKAVIEHSMKIDSSDYFQRASSLFRSNAGEVLSIDRLHGLKDKWCTILTNQMGISAKEGEQFVKVHLVSLLETFTATDQETTQPIYQRARLTEDEKEKHKDLFQKLISCKTVVFKVSTERLGNENVRASENWASKTTSSSHFDALIPTVYAAYSSNNNHLVLIHPEEKNNLPDDYKYFQLAQAFDFRTPKLNEELPREWIYEAWVWGGLFGLLYQKMQGENAFEIYEHINKTKEVIDRFYPQLKWYQQRFTLSKSIAAYFRLDRAITVVKKWLYEPLKAYHESPEKIYTRRGGVFNILENRQKLWAYHFGWDKKTLWKDLNPLKQTKIVKLPFTKKPTDEDYSIDISIGDSIHKVMKKRKKNEEEWVHYFRWPAGKTYGEYIAGLDDKTNIPFGISDDAISAEVDCSSHEWIKALQKIEKKWEQEVGWEPRQKLSEFTEIIGVKDHDAWTKNLRDCKPCEIGENTKVQNYLLKVIYEKVEVFSKILGWKIHENLGMFADRMDLVDLPFPDKGSLFCWFFNFEDEVFDPWKKELEKRQTFWANKLKWRPDETLKGYQERTALTLINFEKKGDLYSREVSSDQAERKPYKNIEITITSRRERFQSRIGWYPHETFNEYKIRMKLKNILFAKSKFSYELPCNDPNSSLIKEITQQFQKRKHHWKSELHWENGTLGEHLQIIKINLEMIYSDFLIYHSYQIDTSEDLSFLKQEMEDRKVFWSKKLGFNANQTVKEYLETMMITLKEESLNSADYSSFSYAVPKDNQQLLSCETIINEREARWATIDWTPNQTLAEHMQVFSIKYFTAMYKNYTPKMVDVDHFLPYFNTAKEQFSTREKYWMEKWAWKKEESLGSYLQRTVSNQNRYDVSEFYEREVLPRHIPMSMEERRRSTEVEWDRLERVIDDVLKKREDFWPIV